MNIKACIFLLLPVLLAACTTTNFSDPFLASGVKDTIKLLPEGDISTDDAQQAMDIVDAVAAEYQFKRDDSNEADNKREFAKRGDRLIFSRAYYIVLDRTMDTGKVDLVAYYTRSGSFEVEIADDSRWGNSLMARRIRFKIVHDMNKTFGKPRVRRKRKYIYGQQYYEMQ